MDIHVRWMIRRDMPEIMEIENASFDFPWPEDEFHRVLRQRGCVGIVAEYSEKVVSHMFYRLHRTRIDLLSLAVHPDCRHNGVGTRMLDKLRSKMAGERNKIAALVRETNLGALLFFKSNGWRAIDLRRGYYSGLCEEDAIDIRYTIPNKVQA